MRRARTFLPAAWVVCLCALPAPADIVTTVVVPGGGSIQETLIPFDINMNTGDVYAITVQSLKSSSSAANTHISINWSELQ